MKLETINASFDSNMKKKKRLKREIIKANDYFEEKISVVVDDHSAVFTLNNR
jgi:predicted metal-binding transcription factor (methanogenesis marker protein 9)